MTKVSVIIPVYDRTEQLKAAVVSVLEQKYSDLELIIIDDGSNINVKKFIPEDKRIKYFRQKHQGVSAARNYGIGFAQGEYIAFLDSDDIWSERKLEVQVKYMEEHPEFLLSQCEEVWIRHGQRVNPQKKHQKKEGDIFADSLQLCLISPSAVIIRKQLFSEIGLFDITLPACEDYDLWLRVTSRYKVGLIKEFLMTRNAGHEDQLSRKYPVMDLFRVRSIRKLLKNPVLTPGQAVAAKNVYSAKKAILVNGAWKRKKFADWLYYKYLI